VHEVTKVFLRTEESRTGESRKFRCHIILCNRSARLYDQDRNYSFNSTMTIYDLTILFISHSYQQPHNLYKY
jgi:hypothetical protein